jgi:hypothetical protein
MNSKSGLPAYKRSVIGNELAGFAAYKNAVIEDENAISSAFIRVMTQNDRLIVREVLEEEKSWIEEEIEITNQRLGLLQAKLADYNKVIRTLPNPEKEERLLS